MDLKGPQRWIVATMGFFAFFNAYTLRICLSIAITKMTKPHSSNISSTQSIDETCPDYEDNVLKNETTVVSVGEFEWDEVTQGIVLSSFYWGYAASHLPGGLLARKFGAKRIIGLGVLFTALLSIATPKVTQWGDAPALMGLRLLMGLCEGVIQPGMSHLLAQWIPSQERSVIGTFVYTGIKLGILVSSVASGLIMDRSTDNWPWIFYIFGAIGILWYVVWVPLCYDSPREHPFITEQERIYLHEHMSSHTAETTAKPSVPWRHVLTSKPFLALVAMQCGQDWCNYTIMSDLPKYMNGVLKLPIHLNGYASSMHTVSSWLFSTFASWLSDRLIAKKRVSISKVRKANVAISSVGPAVFLLLAVYAGCDVVLAVVLVTVGLTLTGSSLIGIKVNVLDLSPNHAGVLMGIQNGVGALAGIAAPYTVGVLTPNQTLGEWKRVFWIIAGVYFVATVNFVINASGDVQPWNNPGFLKKEREKERNDDVEEDVGLMNLSRSKVVCE
ncbi:putative inorganic phosphate cotransporter [Copidosoma floridanum]|uniref:putative inorganic phosphate cotransporter n=1 Tax=Copidosoma floridanum TaxID=29053 RepID=UPI000C6F4C4E|nr:putative inorganic phosphate cotransporter [Copidosoma floridanum]